MHGAARAQASHTQSHAHARMALEPMHGDHSLSLGHATCTRVAPQHTSDAHPYHRTGASKEHMAKATCGDPTNKGLLMCKRIASGKMLPPTEFPRRKRMAIKEAGQA